jgi:hypothetical protein
MSLAKEELHRRIHENLGARPLASLILALLQLDPSGGEMDITPSMQIFQLSQKKCHTSDLIPLFLS